MSALRLAQRFAIAVAILAIAVPLACAQEAKPAEAPPEKPSQSWAVNCNSPGGESDIVCTLSQTLVVKDKGQRVLTAAVLKKNGKYTLNLALPHGLSLQKGVDVWIDDTARKNYPIVTADQKGSYATVALDDKLIADLRKGTTMRVALTAFSGEAIVLELSLNGFSAGFAKL